MSDVTPITLDKLKETLTEDEKKEMDNPYFLDQLLMFIEAVNNFQDINIDRQHAWVMQLR